jgi:WD40 repeat protein
LKSPPPVCLKRAYAFRSRCGTSAFHLFGTVKLWETKTGEEVFTLFGHPSRIFGVAISGDGTRLATAGQDRVARVYLLNVEDLVKPARTRVTRSLTAEECQKYLHVQKCSATP